MRLRLDEKLEWEEDVDGAGLAEGIFGWPELSQKIWKMTKEANARKEENKENLKNKECMFFVGY